MSQILFAHHTIYELLSPSNQTFRRFSFLFNVFQDFILYSHLIYFNFYLVCRVPSIDSHSSQTKMNILKICLIFILIVTSKCTESEEITTTEDAFEFLKNDPHRKVKIHENEHGSNHEGYNGKSQN